MTVEKLLDLSIYSKYMLLDEKGHVLAKFCIYDTVDEELLQSEVIFFYSGILTDTLKICIAKDPS